MDKNAVIKEAQKYLAKGQTDKAIAEWEKLVKEAPDGNTYNTIGDLYLRKGDKKAAVDFFTKAAAFFRGEGFSLKAIALYKKIINIDPSEPTAVISLGELSEEKGLVPDAVRYYLAAADILSKNLASGKSVQQFVGLYEKILSLAPPTISLREKVAGLFAKEGLLSNAIKEYLEIAGLYEGRGDSAQAKHYYKKVLDTQPDNREALIGISRVLEQTDELPQAVEYIRAALKKDPSDPELLVRCALLCKRQNDYDAALEFLAQALELDPSDIGTHRLIGDLYALKGDRKEAWESYRNVVDALVNDDKADDAIVLVQSFKDIDPIGIGKELISLYARTGDSEAVFQELLSVADACYREGLADEYMHYYREAHKINPDDPGLNTLIAERGVITTETPAAAEHEKSIEDLLIDSDIFISYGLHDEAKSILELLALREPDSIEVHARLKTLYRTLDDRGKAVYECLKLAELYDRTGAVESREEIIAEAREISPDDPRLPEAVSRQQEFPLSGATLEEYAEDIAEAEYYLRQGLRDDALRIYQKLLEIFPGDDGLRKQVFALQGGAADSLIEGSESSESGLLQEMGEITVPEETLDISELSAGSEPQFDSDVLGIFEEFKKGLESELEEEDFETHYNLGIAYKEMGLIDDAIKSFQTSQKGTKFLVQSLTMLGICYMDKGLYPLAISAFKDALTKIGSRDDAYWGAQYDLAMAYEMNGDTRDAFDIFSQIYGWNSKFRQVGERLNDLRTRLAAEEPIMKQKKDRVSYL